MKIIVNESQFKNIVNEDYPQTFSFDEFNNIRSYNGKMKYCNTHLQRLSSGSARVAYKVDDDIVLKLAKNRKGIAQNEAEYWSYASETGIAAKTYECDTDKFYWIEMELAKKIKPSDFKRILGYPFYFIQNFIAWTASHYVPVKRSSIFYDHRFVDDFEYIMNENDPNWEWFYSLYDYMANTGLLAFGDLQRLSSWGVVDRKGQGEEIVLIDFGLNDDTIELYR